MRTLPAPTPRLWSLLVVASLSACNFAPHYDPPAMPEVVAFKEAAPGNEAEQGWRVATPKDSDLGDRWWAVYGDEELDALEARVVISNQSVIAAEANYRAARELVSEAQASLFPSLSLAPSAVRTRTSASVSSFASGSNAATGAATTTGAIGTSGATGTTGTAAGGTSTISGTGATATTRTIYSLPLEASYELDLWGSVRNTVAQNRYMAQATAAQLATAILSTQTQLAEAYFELRITDEQRRLLDKTLEDYRTSLHLVQTLYTNGLESDEDVAEAETQLASAEASLTDLGVARAQYEHAIATLIGVPAAHYSLPVREFRQPLPVVPVGVPSDLLERRPDIAAAERQVAAANAAIGIARAAYFPSLTLSASGGYESTVLSNLISGPNRFWSVGPELAQVLFDGGLRRAEVRRARALDDAAAATYRGTVLTAFQAVEDNLAELRILSAEVKQQHSAATSAERAVHLSTVRYQQGVDSYVNVITAQNTFLTSREAELQVQLRQLTASVNLINNLGGGWSTHRLAATEQLADAPDGAPAKTPAANDPAAAGPVEPASPNPPPLPKRPFHPENAAKDDNALNPP
jgi:NodT family efflux transporter outer membrane factor (OMF) lipoprotein